MKTGNNNNKRGRPKGTPTVMRSIGIQKDLNDYLVKKKKETFLSYNALINIAIKNMMEQERKGGSHETR